MGSEEMYLSEEVKEKDQCPVQGCKGILELQWTLNGLDLICSNNPNHYRVANLEEGAIFAERHWYKGQKKENQDKEA